MMKRFAALAAVLAVLLCGCSGMSAMDASYSEDDVAAAAQEVVALANAAAYGEICGLIREDLRASITEDALQDAWGATLTNAGAFVETDQLRFYGTTDESTGEAYATVILTAKYARGQLTYTLSFDHDLALVGLYLK